ncbi:right-handed parallel beta-helix repeat-containing protein [Novosphingobium sp. YJ-S2-02]|uniref:Right-handed parallel beta-helix repeat-containing protein n=1 Tax=Novosphingobium aureum TaxID=2792964 RepID=A0A931HAZ9_9SPHN|nr:right-handed parallel beta-helix repeat-containing protein [Novosphingobium aureum]MBH0112677.1 right-handed parallel beta-helix repeat-containing protein [Novosphingobium aureum]
MPRTQDLAGATLDAVDLKAGTTYVNGKIRYCRVANADNVTLGRGITVITGAHHGVQVVGSDGFHAEGVKVTCEPGVVPVDSTVGIYVRGGSGHAVVDTRIERARIGITMLEVDGFKIVSCDISGIGEDAIRVVGSKNGTIAKNQVHDFADDDAPDVAPAKATHRDGLQMFPFNNARKGVFGIENIEILNNLFFIGKGAEFTPIFNRTYTNTKTGKADPDRPDAINTSLIGNIAFTKGGHAIVMSGTGIIADNLAAGYNDPADKRHTIGKFSLTQWRGKTMNNAAEHWYRRARDGSTWVKGWLPDGDGNRLIKPYSPREVTETIATWRARYRPAKGAALSTGLVAEALAFLQEQQARYEA